MRRCLLACSSSTSHSCASTSLTAYEPRPLPRSPVTSALELLVFFTCPAIEARPESCERPTAPPRLPVATAEWLLRATLPAIRAPRRAGERESVGGGGAAAASERAGALDDDDDDDDEPSRPARWRSQLCQLNLHESHLRLDGADLRGHSSRLPQIRPRGRHGGTGRMGGAARKSGFCLPLWMQPPSRWMQTDSRADLSSTRRVAFRSGIRIEFG